MPEARPVLIVLTGPPAAGKTVLARRLAHELSLPLLAKDDIKERLIEHLGAGDRDWSRRLGAATFDLLYHHTRTLLAAGASLILEGYMSRPLASPELRAILDVTGAACVQVLVLAPPEVVVERYRARADAPDRHPGHLDAAVLDEWRTSPPAPFEPLDLPGELVEVDTTDFALVDYDAVTRWIHDAVDAARRLPAGHSHYRVQGVATE